MNSCKRMAELILQHPVLFYTSVTLLFLAGLSAFITPEKMAPSSVDAAGNIFEPLKPKEQQIIFCAGMRYRDFNQLMNYLNDPARKNPEYRIVQPRNGQDTVAARHTQYDAACFFFATAPIVEQLGYADWELGSHRNYTFVYDDGRRPLPSETLDVGYDASVEHLMASYVDGDTKGFGQQHYQPSFLNPAGTGLNPNPIPCSGDFFPGQEYGLCDPIAGSVYEDWLNELGSGCSGGVHTGCPCDQTSNCGCYWFLNQRLQTLDTGAPRAGCNDARGYRPSSLDDAEDLQRVIKAFVDENIPLLVTVDNGDHFMTLIGYADLDEDGLPKTAIAVDPNYDSGTPDYWIMPSIDDDGSWGRGGQGFTERCSLNSIIPWNQSLHGGCETGGWAKALDASLEVSEGSGKKFAVCSQPSGWSHDCVDPFFGIEITCHDNGQIKREWFRNLENPFIVENGNVDCDTFTVMFADGEHYVKSALLERYQYDVRGEWPPRAGATSPHWEAISRYIPDATPHLYITDQGIYTEINWDRTWNDDYWLVAQNLSDPYTKRRTTILLVLNDDQKVVLEIAPPETYGIGVTCSDADGVIDYFIEADAEVFQDTNFIVDPHDHDCDTVSAFVALGAKHHVEQAAIDRWGYGTSTSPGAWAQITPTGFADTRVSVAWIELSGNAKYFEWDESWPDSYWLVADNIGAGDSEDRKTRIRFLMLNWDTREIQIVPH